MFKAFTRFRRSRRFSQRLLRKCLLVAVPALLAALVKVIVDVWVRRKLEAQLAAEPTSPTASGPGSPLLAPDGSVPDTAVEPHLIVVGDTPETSASP